MIINTLGIHFIKKHTKQHINKARTKQDKPKNRTRQNNAIKEGRVYNMKWTFKNESPKTTRRFNQIIPFSAI